MQAMLDQARTRGQRFDDAVLLIRQGQYKQAREALYKIAMEDPQNKRYRVQMHLAWGMEHLGEGRAPEGQRELERALTLDPNCSDARDALKKLQDAQKKPGLFGKLFGK
jgi:Tfp pilus assembly protein PilF